MSLDREWMYIRYTNGLLNQEFRKGVQDFIDFACNHPEGRDGEKIRCPCNKKKCQNQNFLDVDTVKYHLLRHGFVPGYHVWFLHGETEVMANWDENINYPPNNFGTSDVGESSNTYHRMVLDAAGPEFDPNNMEESPNPDAQQFYDMLSSANQEVWPGCETHSQLSAVARMLHIKSEHHLSERCYDDVCQLMKELMPVDNVMTDNFYSTKQLVKGMGLLVEKIHSCENGCMLYWGEDIELTNCKLCHHPRYKPMRQGYGNQNKLVPYKQMYYFPLTHRLQRLYASEATAAYMRWHAEHEVEEGVMRHCSNSPAWKHFDQMHPSFASESRNVRLGLSTDGFQPFGQSGK